MSAARAGWKVHAWRLGGAQPRQREPLPLAASGPAGLAGRDGCEHTQVRPTAPGSSNPRGTACFHAARKAACSCADSAVLLMSATPNDTVWYAVCGDPVLVRSASRSTSQLTLKSRSAGGTTAAWAPGPHLQHHASGQGQLHTSQQERGEQGLKEQIHFSKLRGRRALGACILQLTMDLTMPPE